MNSLCAPLPKQFDLYLPIPSHLSGVMLLANSSGLGKLNFAIRDIKAKSQKSKGKL